MTVEQAMMVEDCEARESRLNDWERRFIASISTQTYPLTTPQDETLEGIWNRATAKG